MSDKREFKFKEHGVMLFLSKDLYRGFIKLQGDKDLGRSYAGLLPFTEGLYKLGYLSKEVYQVHIKKYSQTLASLEEPKADKKQEKTEAEQKEKQFKGMLEIWDEPHNNKNWRQNAISLAKKFPELESAKLLLAKANEEISYSYG
jgi:hypothetical protein